MRFNSSSSFKPSEWIGNTTKFTQKNTALWSNSDSVNDEFYILTKLHHSEEIRIELGIHHKTSSANYTDILLSSDSSLNNKLIIRFGGKDDRITLYKDSSGSLLLLDESPASITENSSWKCIILLQDDHLSLTAQSLVDDTSYRLNCSIQNKLNINYLGFNIRQSTTSFFGKHAFYSLYAGPILGDTSAPEITDHYVSKDSLSIYFNERVTISKSCLDDLKSEWKEATLNQQQLILHPKHKMTIGKFEIPLLGLCDSSMNCRDTILTFKIFFPDTPEYNDIIINEILFDPEPGAEDFVELYNRSEYIFDISSLQMCRYNNEERTDLKFLSDSSIPFHPKQYYAFSTDLESLCVRYNCKDPSQLIRTSIPPMNNDEGKVLLLFQNSIVDSFHYSEDMHLSLLESVEGVSLERVDPQQETNEPSNWRSASTASLYATPGYKNSHYLELQSKEGLRLAYRLISPDNNGFQDDLLIEYSLASDNYIADLYIFDIGGNLLDHPINAQYISSNGSLNYTLIKSNGSLLPQGNYIAYVEIIGLSGRVLKKKFAFTVASQY